MGIKTCGAWIRPCSLKPQLVVAFCLVSVIPILALLNLILPSVFPLLSRPALVVMVVILAALGFWVVKRIVDAIMEIHKSAKVIARGELSHTIDVSGPQEISELGDALNTLAQHIKHNMDELKIYGERTKEINNQVHRQVLVLSGLAQISHLVTSSADLKDVFDAAIAKLMSLASSAFAFLVLEREGGFEMVASIGLTTEVVGRLKGPSHASVLKIFLATDKSARSDQAASFEPLLKLVDARHMILYPVLAQGAPRGIIAVGHRRDVFGYTDDDVELIGLFAKQISIVVENRILSRKVQELEVRDGQTDLYNSRYITTWLDEEVLRAISHQKPCSLVIVRIQNLDEIRARFGVLAAGDILMRIADILRGALSPLDRAGRVGDNEFGVVFPETNKRQAGEKAAGIRQRIEVAFDGSQDAPHPRIWVGAVENPIDGADAASLFQKAHALT